MDRRLIGLFALAGLLCLPFLLLGGLGFLWLQQRGWMWALAWTFGATLCSSLAYLGFLKWGKNFRPPTAELSPVYRFPPEGVAAWDKVLTLRAKYLAAPPDANDSKQVLACLRDVVETVARHYHPESHDPLLETPLAQLSRVAELVARDVRETVAEKIPLSHALTINQLRGLGRVGDWAIKAYQLYRGVSFVLAPQGALLREAQTQLLGNTVTQYGKGLVQEWLLELIILRTGYHAIELYGGYLRLDEQPVEARVTAATVENDRTAGLREVREGGEPLRFLIVGQVKAGKSSLINAIFGRVEAAVDILPTTSRVEPYRIQAEDGLPEAILLDTGGYDDPSQAADFFRGAVDEVRKADLVLLATSATSASRASDRRLLDELTELFRSGKERGMPPLVAVLTHVDQLRPLREWSPPYDLADVEKPKVRSMLSAMEAVAEDLGLRLEQVVPVCLSAKSTWNVEETLIPAMLALLPEAQRSRYLRCLKDARDAEHWERMGRQFRSSAGVLRDFAAQAGKRTLDRLGAWAANMIDPNRPRG